MRKRNYNLKLTGLAAAMASLGTVFSLPAHALQVVSQGDLSVNVDTTLSVGTSFRAADVNYENVGRYNAAEAQGVDSSTLPQSAADDAFKRHKHLTGSQDNSNLRWQKNKPFSEIVKGTIDVQAEYQNYGAFTRGRFFYDNAIVKDEGGNALPAFYPTTDAGAPSEPAQKEGRGAEFLDAFVYGNFTVSEMPLNVRLGNQVVNWGEGVLFANGINTINPVDVNALLAPGAELKEALIPVKMLYSSLGINDSLSAEAFYQFAWEETRTPDCGTFFNTTDLVGENCLGGFYGSGFDTGAQAGYLATLNRALSNPQLAGLLTTMGLGAYLNKTYTPENFLLPRGGDVDPDNGGEYGFAFRYYIDAIKTEVGAYYMNYHSRLPIISGYAPSAAAMAIPNSKNPGATVLGAVQAGLFPAAGVPSLLAARTSVAIAETLSTGQFAIEYPEDIQLFGLSFNTGVDIGLPGGETAIAGEISYRKDQPYQVEDSVLLTGLLGAPSQICAGGVDTNADGTINCFDEYSAGEFISGGVRDDFYQAEVSFIHFFDQLLGADRWSVLVNAAYNYANIPDKGELLLNSGYNADLRPAWSALQTPSATTSTVNDALYGAGVGAHNLYPTRSSYGYKLRFSGEYSNVFAGVNLIPTLSFSHDLQGVTPGPVANFLEERKALGLSLEANYLNMYKVDVGYTDFFGAEPYNQLNDRDFYSISASVSF